MGRPRQFSDAESEARRREAGLSQQSRRASAYACIGPIPAVADPERRAAALADYRVFCREYHSAKFYLPDSPDHARLDDAITEAICSDGLDEPRAFAYPRGCGKTTRSVIGVQWAVLGGRKRFPVLIGSNDAKAGGMLRTILDDFVNNPELAADFPEVCFPLIALENKKQRRFSQTYEFEGQRYPTHIDYDDHKLILPWVRGSVCSQAAFASFGVTSKGLRGTQYLNKATGEIVRPDLIVLDDVQNDESALSATQCSKIKRIMEAAVKFMKGPQRPCAVFMPCTVLFEGDVADEYTDRKRKPRWRGLRVSMLKSMPTDMTAWTRYFDFRDDLYQTVPDAGEIAERLNAYYAEHVTELTAGAVASWPENYDPGEVDAIQHAMHLFRDDEESFWSECQNKPQSRSVAVRPLEPAELAAKQTKLERGEVPADAQWVVSFVDLHSEIFYWLTMAVGADFTGAIVDYGTWPQLPGRYIHKREANRLRGLSRAFANAHPDQAAGKAPFEAKIYHGLAECTEWLLGRSFPVAGDPGRTLTHQRVGIDIRWGDAAAVCKRFLREQADSRLVGCFGQYVGASSKPFSEYQRTKGWLFETDLHPHLSDARWILRTDNTHLRYLLNDANALKTFLMRRLGSPLGSAGSISLFRANRATHEMLCDHICKSEAPLAVTSRGRSVDEWKVTPQKPDNDFLDCAAGCMALASWAGASLKTAGHGQGGGRRQVVTMAELRRRALERKK